MENGGKLVKIDQNVRKGVNSVKMAEKGVNLVKMAKKVENLVKVAKTDQIDRKRGKIGQN